MSQKGPFSVSSPNKSLGSQNKDHMLAEVSQLLSKVVLVSSFMTANVINARLFLVSKMTCLCPLSALSLGNKVALNCNFVLH